jgi:hypothetical protein
LLICMLLITSKIENISHLDKVSVFLMGVYVLHHLVQLRVLDLSNNEIDFVNPCMFIFVLELQVSHFQ